MSLNEFGIFDQMIEGVQVIDKNSQYLYVNDAVVIHSKKTRKELLGKTMEQCYPGIKNTPLFKHIQDCFKSGRSQEWINEFDFPDGNKGFFQLRIIPIHNAVLIMSFDVTNQKKAEAVIENTNKYLEEIVKTRTEELLEQNKIINQQLHYLKELNNTKDKFFSIVAHDLMAPLRSVLGLTNLLRFGETVLTNDEFKKTTNQLHDSVQNTLELAENLITWSGSQMQSSLTTKMEQFPIESMVSEVYGLYKDLAERKGITLNYKVESGLQVSADKQQLSFIMRNLVNNAIKFTPSTGAIKISAGLHNKNQIHISVSDNGTGIPNTIMEGIKKFGKNESVYGTHGEKGTGLGLMLCHEFIQLNKGVLEVESNEGQGSTFRVLLNSLN